MKLIIAGSRHWTLPSDFIDSFRKVHNLYGIEEIVSGGVNGIDSSGVAFAEKEFIDITEFSADWNEHGKAAEPIRNRKMAEYGDALLLIWDGYSRGSANMKKEMDMLGKPIYEVVLRKSNMEDL